MQSLELGHIRVDRIVESVCKEFAPLRFFPETTPEDWRNHRAWMEPLALDPASGNLVFVIQSFLVRTRHHTILVDSCVGNDKSRPQRPFWDMLKLDTFLPRLAQAGVQPEDVDYVMCTHLHSDHVGWNTRLYDGRWVPTFPNARYVFAKTEWESWQALHAREPQQQIIDSMLPVIEAQQAQLVDDDFALDDEVWLEPTPGHTRGHASIHLTSAGAQAVVTGDMIHSPVQCLHPEWIIRADLDPQLAKRSRRCFLERYCDSAVTICATHFPQPSFGRIVPRQNAFWFEYASV